MGRVVRGGVRGCMGGGDYTFIIYVFGMLNWRLGFSVRSFDNIRSFQCTHVKYFGAYKKKLFLQLKNHIVKKLIVDKENIVINWVFK